MRLKELEEAINLIEWHDFNIEDVKVDKALDTVFLAARLYLKQLKKEAEGK